MKKQDLIIIYIYTYITYNETIMQYEMCWYYGFYTEL